MAKVSQEPIPCSFSVNLFSFGFSVDLPTQVCILAGPVSLFIVLLMCLREKMSCSLKFHPTLWPPRRHGVGEGF